MQHLFLGFDSEDIFFHNRTKDLQTFIVGKPSFAIKQEVLSVNKKYSFGEELDLSRTIVCQGESISLPIRPWLLPR